MKNVDFSNRQVESQLVKSFKCFNSLKSNAESTKIAKSVATEPKERSSTKTSSNGLLTCSHLFTSLSIKQYQLTGCDHFGVITGMWNFPHVTEQEI